MKIAKTLVYLAAAGILSLFIALTLASSGTVLIRTVSAVCTVGILCCLLISLALRTAMEDRRSERISGEKTSLIEPIAMGVTASLPSVISWLVLCATAGSGFNFYPTHKLINGFFLQVYNIINGTVYASELTSGELWIMGVLTLIPAAVFLAAYFIAYSKDGRKED